MAKAKRHIHKYHKVNAGTVTVFACALSDCSHYQPNHMTELLNGKKSICWGCNDEFLLDPMSMEMKQPECANCRLGVVKEPPISVELQKSLNEYVTNEVK